MFFLVHSLTSLLVACVLLVAGAFSGWISALRLKSVLTPLVEKSDLNSDWFKKSSLINPWREVLFGAILTAAIPLFVNFLLSDTDSVLVAVFVGYIAGLLCALGAYSRMKKDLGELGIVQDIRLFNRLLAVFTAGLLAALWGAVTIAAFLITHLLSKG